MIDENAVAVAAASSRAGTFSALTMDEHRDLVRKAILAYESAKPKEAEGLKELAATCPTIQKAGRKLAADRVSGKVVVGCYGDVPAVEFKRLAAMLSAAGDGR